MVNNELYLNDLLNLPTLENVKIKFNVFDGKSDPLDRYRDNPEIVNTEWLFWRSKTYNFSVGQIVINLLKVKGDIWLLTTIKKISKKLDVINGSSYEGEEIETYKPFFGRTLIYYHLSNRSHVRFASGIIEQLMVTQLLPSIFDDQDFPGYEKVRLSFTQLEAIIKKHKKDWVAALENQKAIYLIRDAKTGKLYVGAAYGDNGMLLARWGNYVENGHGGNIELRAVVDKQGFDYVRRFFSYSILENYNARVDSKLILLREAWWKETLGTREPFGYNLN